jgi:hypothetical protein
VYIGANISQKLLTFEECKIMSTFNIKKAKKACHPLKRAVMRQFGDSSSFYDSVSDIANHGASGGVCGFIYYSDTVAFTKRNKNKIMQSLAELSNDTGESIIGMLSHWQCLKGFNQREIMEGLYNPKSDNKTTVYNALAWYALEEVATVVYNEGME